MQLTNGNLYWNKLNLPTKQYKYLMKDITADVVVVGGGISGAITTYFLAKQGLKVVVVEKNIIGYGSTSATTALLEYQVDIDMADLDNMIGNKYSNRIYELCKESINDIEEISSILGEDVGFARKDALYYSSKLYDQNSMKDEYEVRKNAGYPVSYVTKDDILNLKTGIRTKNCSAVLDPYNFTQRLFAYLQKNFDVTIYENTEIVDLKCDIQSVKSITQNNASINSKYVFFCSGFETTKYLPKSSYTLYRTFTIITKQIPELKNLDTNFTGRDMSNPYHYIRFTNDNRIIYGGEDVLLTKYYTNEKNIKKTAKTKYEKLLNKLKKEMYPKIRLEKEYEFNGIFANTKDTLPLIDEIPNMPNCYCNLGFGSNGVLYSVIGARLLSNLVIGSDTKDISMFRILRNNIK